MLDETARELELDPGKGTSGTASTYDPLGTVPYLGEGKAAGEAPASFAVGMGAVAGQRYRILGTLGEGGMGVVYRAEDTRLGRNVAVKTVPAERTANLWAKERFLNEARAASALDHPNLCTIYEIEETGTGQLFLTMPCYDGETLRSRLKRGPLSLPEAIHIAQQAARGLAKLHGLGIIHCDIKPANLMLTGDGIVKILDFGIARLSGPSPHIGPYGTRGYRSPEQARGDEVEASSDVWSLGVVLYEMLTGWPPGRDENEETLPWNESDSIARLPPEAPPKLAGILSRMLARDQADRYPQAVALLVDLDPLVDRITSVLTRHHTNSRRRFWTGLGTAVTLLAILGGYAMVEKSRMFSGRRSAPALPRALEPVISQITDFPERTSYPSLSPDGSSVLYVRSIAGRDHIFSQPPVRGASATDLSADSLADDTQPSFSPDGRQIVFRSERNGGGLFLMPAKGGAVRPLTNFGFNPAWSPDGREIVCGTANITHSHIRRTTSEVFRVHVATGARRRVTQGDAAQPSWSPDGRRIAYWGLVPPGRRVIWTIPAEGGEAVPAVADAHFNWNPVWSPDGRFLYFASDRGGIMNLWRVPIDEGSGRTRGQPEPITTSQQAGMLPSLSQDGRQIAYASDASKGTIEKVAFDPATGKVFGPVNVIARTSGVIIDCTASLDGMWLVYELLTPREDLFIVHPDGSGQRQLIGDEHRYRIPIFSPDSSRISFYSDRSGEYEIWTIGIDGQGLVQETSIPGEFVSTALWSHDGKMLAVAVSGREALIDLAKPLKKRVPQFLPPPDRDAGFFAYSWSVDGRWLAGARRRQDGSHDPGILLYSLAGKRYTRLTNSGRGPSWLNDSRRLLYVDGDSLFLLDTESRKSRLVVSHYASNYNDTCSSPDDRVLYLVRTFDEGFIWLLKLQ
jgi:serine/threonine protein kinase